MIVKRKRHRKPLPWLWIKAEPKTQKGSVGRRICAVTQQRSLMSSDIIATYELHSTKGWRRYSQAPHEKVI